MAQTPGRRHTGTATRLSLYISASCRGLKPTTLNGRLVQPGTTFLKQVFSPSLFSAPPLIPISALASNQRPGNGAGACPARGPLARSLASVRMFLWQAFKNLGTPSSVKRRKVSGAAGGATQGAESHPPQEPPLAVQRAPPPPPPSQEVGHDGCTPEEAEPQPLYAPSPYPGGTPSSSFKRFAQPKGMSFQDRNATKVGWRVQGRGPRPES